MSQSLHIKVTKGIDNDVIGSGSLYTPKSQSASKLVSIIKSIMIDDSEELFKYREVDDLLYSSLLIEAIGDRLSNCNNAGNDEQYNSSGVCNYIINKLKRLFWKECDSMHHDSAYKKASISVNVDTKVVDAQILYSGTTDE